MKKWWLLAGVFANSIGMMFLVFRYNNILKIQPFWFAIGILWIFLSWSTGKDSIGKMKKYVAIAVFLLILLGNAFILYELPPISYKKACAMVKDSMGEEDAIILDNKEAKQSAEWVEGNTLISYRPYTIVLEIDGQETVFQMDPYIGK